MSIDYPDPPLTDGVIGLEPLTRLHLEHLEALGREPDVGAHTYVPQPFGSDDAVRWLARYLGGWRDGTSAGFAVTDERDRSFAGFCALVHIDAEGEQAEIGYITKAAARGRGVAVRAVKLVSAWAFETLGLKRLELRVDDHNPASMKVAERAGFEWEGLMRSIYFKQGLRENLHVYSRLPDDPPRVEA